MWNNCIGGVWRGETLSFAFFFFILSFFYFWFQFLSFGVFSSPFSSFFKFIVFVFASFYFSIQHSIGKVISFFLIMRVLRMACWENGGNERMKVEGKGFRFCSCFSCSLFLLWGEWSGAAMPGWLVSYSAVFGRFYFSSILFLFLVHLWLNRLVCSVRIS